jgi:hypothetical protein
MDGEPCLPTEALLTTGSLRQACASWTSSLRHRALYLRRLWADRGASGALHEIATVDGRSLPCGVSSREPHAPRLRVPEPDLLSRGDCSPCIRVMPRASPSRQGHHLLERCGSSPAQHSRVVPSNQITAGFDHKVSDWWPATLLTTPGFSSRQTVAGEGCPIKTPRAWAHVLSVPEVPRCASLLSSLTDSKHARHPHTPLPVLRPA